MSNSFKYSVIRVWFIAILLFRFIRNLMPWHKAKRIAVPLDADFIKSMEDAAKEGDICVDFEKAIVQMSSRFYSQHLCLGDYQPVNDIIAHHFFMKIRQWINLRRGYLNGSRNMSLPQLYGSDMIKFGVTDDEGNLFILGYETETLIVFSPNKH